jgi:hypothetical protein
MNGCARLLLAVLKSEGEATTKFQALYLPLMPRLRGLLATHGIAISTYPFDQFTRALIELYLRAVLGPKPQTNVMIRKIGCGCHDCNDLDTFLLSTPIDHHFRLAKARRTHLEMYLRRNTDLVTFQTIRNKSPHSLCDEDVRGCCGVAMEHPSERCQVILRQYWGRVCDSRNNGFAVRRCSDGVGRQKTICPIGR